MDPLSITTAFFTFHTTLVSLKRFADEFSDAPRVISELEEDCRVTFEIICHARSTLDFLARDLRPDDFEPDVDIRAELANYINLLQPEVEDLRSELRSTLSQPSTRLAWLTSRAMLHQKIKRFAKAHKNIAKKLEEFVRLQTSLNQENLIRILCWQHSQGQVSDTSSFTTTHRRESAGVPASLTLTADRAEHLLDAVNRAQHSKVRTILEERAVSPNVQVTEDGMYPLHIAASRGDVEMIKILLHSRADIEVRNRKGKTPLHIATSTDMVDAVQLLIHQNANPNAHDKAGFTPLWYAAGHGTSPRSFALLTSRGADVVDHRCAGSLPTPLWAAAAKRQVDTATALLTAGADANVFDEKGATLLHQTAWPTAAALTPLLLKHGADATARDGEGKQPLHRAAEVGKVGIVAALLEVVDVNIRATDGATALMHATDGGHLRTCRFLVESRGADWTLCDEVGNDAFYVACANGQMSCASYLLGLARGARDVSGGNSVGNTPLHAAARWQHVEMVKWLLDLGADKSALSSKDSPELEVTPAQAARRAIGLMVDGESEKEALARREELEEIASFIDNFQLE